MSEIRTRPASREYRANFDRIFKKADRPRGETVTGSLRESSHDENIDWGEFRTRVCCTDDPHFGG